MSIKREKITQKQVIGKIGEDCACKYLGNRGYVIICRNYLRKWGEIDIVAKKDKELHFIEVKSVSRNLTADDVPHETTGYRPEDNVHPWKMQRLSRAIQSYIMEKDIPENDDWQFDVIIVQVDMRKRISKVSMLDDVVL